MNGKTPFSPRRTDAQVIEFDPAARAKAKAKAAQAAERPQPVRPADAPSDAQADFIRRLLTAQADIYASMDRTAEADAVRGILGDIDALMPKTKREASLAIDRFLATNAKLKAEARDYQAVHAPAADTRQPLEDGLYQLADGTVVKLQYNRAGGDGRRLYGKVLDAETGSFDYAPGIMRKVTVDDKMSLDQAAAFGRLYGRCVACGRELTDEASIAAGIGPVCVKRF